MQLSPALTQRAETAASTAEEDLRYFAHFQSALKRYSSDSSGIEPSYSCPTEGLDGRADMSDMWLCNARLLDAKQAGRTCVVYSFGSHGFDQFVQNMTRHTTCEIHTFHPSLSSSGSLQHPYTIGPIDSEQGDIYINATSQKIRMKRLSTIMRELGHHVADVIRIDAQGLEFQTIRDMALTNSIRAVREIQIEVQGGGGDKEVWEMMDILNNQGMVVFHKENILKSTGREGAAVKAVKYALTHLAPRPFLLQPERARLVGQAGPALSSSGEVDSDFLSEYAHLHKTELAICGRVLVFDCNLLNDCGGLADRMTGTITAAMVSILTNRSFVLHQDYFNESFQPAHPDVDWRWSKQLENCTRNSPVFEFVNKDHAWADFLEHFGDRPIVRVSSNRGFLHGLLDHPRYRMQLAKWRLTKCNIFGRMFDGLFKPTQALTNTVQKILPWHGDLAQRPILTVGMHFRMGDRSFDPRVAALAVGRDVINLWDLTFKCAKSATSAAVALWGEPVKVRFFVMTDHAGLKNYIRANHSKDHVMLSDMAPVHINGKEYRKYHKADDTNHVGQRLAVMQTYAEWYAYSLSNLFILSPRRSGFSRLSIMRALASRHPRFPEYGVIRAEACSTMGRASCKALGQEGAKVL
ncbi:METTL24 [Symbiodinium sp. CCMP2592]|nr:METTL24 [Symbiodinium sp. CCMP2592]